ncbi:uncharacterized protein LOC121730194 [Aricia agestis]|uniref:uncharacterized protein LOC121730194 n=1 Tax=Aricia agestis TaxID=91739 RepID=UPI001C20A2F5|nr:uncharacterized protein LOC121730194 [Aricia agestis]
METGAVVNEFVTIVPVGETKPADKEPAFVTVLTLGAEKGAAEISIRRPKGARLGLGLKFEGGSAASEKVRRLLVQSCAEDSPAANACAPWGKLIPGDEILAIDGVSVSELTRIECVRRLKDSDEILKLLVRHFEVEPITQSDHSIMEKVIKDQTDSGRPTMLPPPVPPRKLGKKNSFKDKPTLQTVGEQNAILNIDGQKQGDGGKDLGNRQNGTLPANNKLSRKSSFDSHLLRQNKDSFAYLRKGSPEEARRLVRRLSDGKTIPPDAEVYVDLLSNEWERCLILADAESDDTGSSISTVVDRLGSMASSVENSIPSTPVMQPKSIDIQKVLNSIENIDTDLLKDMRNAKFMDKPKNLIDEPRKIVEKVSTVNITSNNENLTQSKSSSEKISSKSVETNDKNNNNTKISSNRENLEKSQSAPNKSDQYVPVDKPKPMPRNTKIERSASEKKRRPAPIPEVLTSPLPEPLLTPTKKTCIETWLQHSEAEMNESLKDKVESNPVPEILPRLIDFVPKTQFKESGNESTATTCTRPTVPPPPPPAETREDGSGASLDTIGELDEPSDVTDNAVQSTESETEKSKTYDRSFWNDRVNKSDIEDKSLSNDESPLPTCPRQPPDGVETPSETVEKIPELPTRLPPSRLSTGWTSTRPRYSYSSRTQDARSEASVKDKIAMFSVESASTDCVDKCSTLPTRSYSTLRKNVTPYKSSYVEVSSLDRRLTKSQDNLDETPRSYKRQTERPEVLGALKTNISTNIVNKPQQKSNINDKPLFYGSTTNLQSDTSFMRPVYHARSISDDTSKKDISSHKSNLEYLIEQRKKSMSKLRGLVIPEVQTAVVDLPEIKVKDSFSKIYLQNLSYTDNKKQQTSNDNGRINLCENKWKSNLLPNNIPKYSPAFKRKSLQVYTSLSKEPTPERKILDKTELSSKKIGSPISIESMKKTYDYNKSPLYKTTNYILSKDYSKNNLNNSTQDYKNVEIKVCTATDIVDSDNDSAMSSTQSSYRSSASSPMYTLDTIESDNSRLSPRISNYSNYSMVKHEVPIKTYVAEKVTNDDFIKRKVCRSMSSDTNISLSSSAGSAATSGSQASCSSLESSVADSDKRRVSKTYNVDTINRRNILASAKCRSGRDAKLESPVLETKFSHESYNRSPSPINKSSECLSTLTSTVSAIANKGENRRRNKFILESDSDSDSEKNMRVRKSEYKNSRLKRNSSTNKKQNEGVCENGKVEQKSSFDREEIVKEVKKIATNGKFQINGNTNKTVNNRKEVEELYKGIPLQHRTSELITTNNSLRDDIPQATTKVGKISNINTTSQNISTQTFRLRKGSATGVGLILAGGTDCEAKDVTVHRVLVDGIAAKAGIRRGSKVRSINGNLMSGLTHAQSVSILKEQRAEVVIEIENENFEKDSNTDCGSEDAESKGVDAANGKLEANSTQSIVTVLLEKIGGGAGLGFGLDGGRDSPQGDRPLTIKKLFAGGAAAQSGRVMVGAELLSAGGQSMEGYTRTQAWAALKALPPGQVALVLRNPTNSDGEK